MSMAVVFWILMLLWLVFGFLWSWPGNPVATGPYGPIGNIGNTVLLFILLVLLGWHVFGAPVHG